MTHSLKGLLHLVLCALFMTSAAFAQGTAQINGRVTDESNAVLPGVSVTATQVETGFTRTVVTDEDVECRLHGRSLSECIDRPITRRHPAL